MFLAPSPVASFGVSYFGVRDLTWADADLALIAAQGFAWVMLPMTQDDAVYEGSTFRALVRIARHHGLEAIVSPWGGQRFGGEGLEAGLPILQWFAACRDSGADVLHLDEPVGDLVALCEAWDGPLWMTLQPDRAAAVDPKVSARIKVLGTDPYDGTLEQRVQAARQFRDHAGRLDLVWVKAFSIAEREEPAVGKQVAALSGLAEHVGVWAWMGATGRGILRSDRPLAVQEAVSSALAVA